MTPAQKLTKTIRNYLTLKGWLVWKNSGGAFRVGERFVRMGEKKGLPDLMATRLGCCLAIEIKASKGDRVSPEQQAWLDALSVHHWRCIVAHNLDDVIEVIE